MNPYEVLQIPSNASASQIKEAYRRAVKKFHPDVSKGIGDDSIKLVNEAYAILSDPERKARYDLGGVFVTQHVAEEDPRELYKREYIRKKRMEALEKKAREKRIFDVLYKINLGVFTIAFLLVLDSFLPTITRHELGIDERIREVRVRHSSHRIRYILTENRRLAIPSESYFNHDYSKPKPLTIEFSPLFRVPREVRLAHDGKEIVFEPIRTIFSFFIPFHYLLLTVSGVALVTRSHTSFTFSYSFTPPLILLLCVIIFLVLA